MPESQQALVSFLLPVYNAERYLPRCLDSILVQTYQTIEIIAIDDGSKDSSGTILDTYAREYPDRFTVEHRPNGGVAAARNRAIEIAHGAYLCFIDNDDFVEPDYVETLVRHAEASGSQVVCGGFRRPDESGRIVQEVIPVPGTDWAPYTVEAAWAKIYRTEYVKEGGFTFLSTNIGEDLFFTLPAIASAKSVEVIPYVGYNWFFNTKSVSSTAHRSSKNLQFEFTLNSLATELEARSLTHAPLTEHYLVKLIAWFLLYTCRGDDASDVRANRIRYTRWLDEHLPSWRSDPRATPFKPSGESALNRFAVWLFVRHPLLFSVAQGAYRAAGAHIHSARHHGKRN